MPQLHKKPFLIGVIGLIGLMGLILFWGNDSQEKFADGSGIEVNMSISGLPVPSVAPTKASKVIDPVGPPSSMTVEAYLKREKLQITGGVAIGQHSGEPVVAEVVLPSRRHVLVPNQIGVFERLYLEPSQEVIVTVGYPEANPGDKIVAEVNDGGLLGNGRPTDVMVLDEAAKASFKLKLTDAFGTHRVVLYHNGDRKIMDFWVGKSEREFQ